MIKLFMLTIIFSISTYGQTYVISQYEKYDNDKKISNYFNKLNEDDNSIILKINDNKFIVYKNDIEIYKFSVGYLSGLVINKEKIDNLKLIEYQDLLDSLYKINPLKLNETKNNITNQTLELQDASNYNLQLIKNNYFVDYNSYAPHEYIEFKAAFYEERVKFLNVFKKANKLFDESSKEYLEIIKIDTIYFESPTKELIKKLNIVEDKNKYSNKYNFRLQNRGFIVVDKNNQYKSNRHLINKKDEILNFEFFDLYGFEILKNSKKTIYIIELEELKKNKKKCYKTSYINIY